MGMKFRFRLAGLLLSLLILTACSNNNSASSSSGIGVLYLTAQGNTTISAFSLALSSGGLTQIGTSLGTGAVPFAVAITPGINALFVSNNGANNLSSYAINSDGSLSAVSGNSATGSSPMGMAIDPAGKFLFVSNQGTFQNAASGTVSAFTIQGTTLTAVAGSPFATEAIGELTGSGPVAVAVSNSGNFLYAANQFDNTVAAFSVNSSSGALTPLGASPYSVGTSPSGLAISPNGGFLYVTNAGSNDVSAFAICDIVVTTCANVNSPDGSLTPVSGSPFPAGVGPVTMAFDPAFTYAYVVDKQSNQISQYSYGTGSGVLSPLSPAAISTGTTPVSIAVRSGTTGTNIGNTTTNPTDFVFVANNGASTISTFTLNTTTGVLNVSGMPFTTFDNPSAVAAR
jgi:6-phosphogluconolactonase